MKQIVFSTFLLLLAHIVVSQQHPGMYIKLEKAGERSGDPFSELPEIGMHKTLLGKRNLNHTQLDSAKYWTWNDTLATWSLESQTNYSYSSNAQVLLKLNENLENQFLETWQFDDNGSVLEFIYQIWNGSAWLNSFRFNYLYDGNGNLVEFIYQSSTGGSYENALRIAYTYDGNGDLAEQLTQNWDAGAWTNSSKRTYTYNGNHQQILVLQEQWQNGWFNQFRYTYTYGGSDELLTYLVEEWELDWVIIEQTAYVYDGQLNLIEEAGQQYEGGILVWETKIIYAYDIHGNQTSIIHQNTDSGQLANSWHEVISYDDENNQISYVYQYWDAEWVSNDSAFFYWNPVTSVDNESTLSNELVVFPNPATHELHYNMEAGVEMESYEIQSLDGIIIHRARIFAMQPIDISGLPHGMYVLKLYNRQQAIRQQRFIKM